MQSTLNYRERERLTQMRLDRYVVGFPMGAVVLHQCYILIKIILIYYS